MRRSAYYWVHARIATSETRNRNPRPLPQPLSIIYYLLDIYYLQPVHDPIIALVQAHCCSPIRIMPRRKWKGWSKHSFGNVNTCDDFRYLLSPHMILDIYWVKVVSSKWNNAKAGHGCEGEVQYHLWTGVLSGTPDTSPLLMIAYQLVYSLLIILLYELSGPDDCLKLAWSLLGPRQYAVILPCTVSDLVL